MSQSMLRRDTTVDDPGDGIITTESPLGEVGVTVGVTVGGIAGECTAAICGYLDLIGPPDHSDDVAVVWLEVHDNDGGEVGCHVDVPDLDRIIGALQEWRAILVSHPAYT